MSRIDTSTLPYPKPVPRQKRERKDDDREHKALIEKLPCLVGPVGCRGCTVVHHIRRTGDPKSRGMGMRSVHKWGLPLCDGHHTRNADALHRTGDEVKWWSERGIDFIAVAEALWRYRGRFGRMLAVVGKVRME